MIHWARVLSLRWVGQSEWILHHWEGWGRGLGTIDWTRALPMRWMGQSEWILHHWEVVGVWS